MAENIVFGYARVSTKDQKEDRQVEELKKQGIENKNIFIDKVSGKDFNRDQYQLMLKMLRSGDVLYVKSIDRFGRNYTEILDQWRYITKEINADIVVLDMPLLDTRKNKDLIGTLISDIVLQLLSYVAQSERETIRQRQAEGIALAKEKGVYKGRQPIKVDKEEFERIFAEVQSCDRTNQSAMRKLGLKPTTYYKFRNEYLTKTGMWCED